ncbi:CDK5RAP1-like protein [Sitophilus oryzae]|uniref:CDK5RAP1-like protein n=1 Tax=Sitophilus oryzae TaxID=7048 RepID=A0A6J2Y677_SITOR|nr:CDK5RAP1-like protein [Sitophilus oryzae]
MNINLKHGIQSLKLSPSVVPLLRNNVKVKYQNCNYCIASAQSNTSKLQENNSDNDSPQLRFRKNLLNGPNLRDFFKAENLSQQDHLPDDEVIPYLTSNDLYGQKRKVFFEVYGCQMNVNDTEIVWAILEKHNYEKTENLLDADVVLIVTCAIRDSAEERIWGRLNYLRGIKNKNLKRSSFKIGILGCMAERLKEKVLEKDKTVDVVAGPDAYRDLPRLLALTENNQKSVNVLLSYDETYADITPVRLNENSVSAYVSIMRGCDNMCTYCIVPFTRGRERSRPVSSILREVEHLSESGVKEVTLLGQNVNSYRDISEDTTVNNITTLAKGFKTVYKPKKGGLRFADLLYRVSEINPEMRIRFMSPHPKDFPDEVIQMIKTNANICKNLHMPAQSGNSAVLERMRRGYTREAYLELVKHIRNEIPDVALSSDFICGFCGETDEEFEDTITLMDEVKYNTAFLFPYSMREKTTAHRRFKDDVPKEVKIARLQRMVTTFRHNAFNLNTAQIGKVHLVLIEGFSKRSQNYLQGRNDHNIKVILPGLDTVPYKNGTNSRLLQPGDYVAVQINMATSQVLKGIPLYLTDLQEFYQENLEKCAGVC